LPSSSVKSGIASGVSSRPPFLACLPVMAQRHLLFVTAVAVLDLVGRSGRGLGAEAAVMMVAAEVLSDCRNVWRQGPMPMPLDDYSFGCASASQTTNLTASGMIGTLTATLRVTNHRRALFSLSGLFFFFSSQLVWLGYEPGGPRFESCRARHSSQGPFRADRWQFIPSGWVTVSSRTGSRSVLADTSHRQNTPNRTA
jgi:hypothetical protein